MNDTYRYVHNTYFKNSVHIVDHFHIVKLFTEAIQTIRIRIMKNNDKNAKAYNFLILEEIHMKNSEKTLEVILNE